MKLNHLALALPLLVVMQTASANAQVVVNGSRLTPNQVAQLEAIACRRIPSGNYWLNGRGQWGYAGNPWPQGHLTERCVARRAPSRQSQAQQNLQQWRSKSLSERGMLFGPNDY